jgi:hypothetical protein
MNRIRNSFDVITNMIDTLKGNLDPAIPDLIRTRCAALLQKIAPEPQQTLNYVSPLNNHSRNSSGSTYINKSIQEDSSISLQQAIDLGSRYGSYDDYLNATTKNRNAPLLLVLTEADIDYIWNSDRFSSPPSKKIRSQVPPSIRKPSRPVIGQRTRRRR